MLNLTNNNIKQFLHTTSSSVLILAIVLHLQAVSCFCYHQNGFTSVATVLVRLQLIFVPLAFTSDNESSSTAHAGIDLKNGLIYPSGPSVCFTCDVAFETGSCALFSD